VADYSIWVLEYACAPHSPACFLIHGQQGTRELPYTLTVLQSEQRTVLVDTGFVNDGFSRTLGELDGITRWTHPRAVLGRIGVDPGEVDTILLTHAHYDHLGTLEQFPNASHGSRNGSCSAGSRRSACRRRCSGSRTASTPTTWRPRSS
jgi:N-acyl homoserine lactone hydrolase